MKNRKLYHFFIAILAVFSLIGCKSQPEQEQHSTLKNALKGKFYIGTAMNTPLIEGSDSIGVGIIKTHFNSVVAENCMKSEILQPSEGIFDFSLADEFVKFGVENNMFIIGHTLIWHSQAPDWFFIDENGNDVSRQVLIERMKNHINTVVSRYKGRVNGWDVVNEAINDDGTWRETKFYNIIGPEYVKLAFEFAHEADPNAELYYNDYSMAHEGRRTGIVNMIKDIQEQEVQVDGIGMQAHCGMTWPDLSDFEESLLAFANLGVKVMITELDISVLPSPGHNVGADVSASFEFKQKYNPYVDGMPDSVAMALNNRYFDFFKLFLKHQDKISRVTLWGVNDAQSWRNYWPVKGRTDYPLLFNRQYKAKPIVEDIIEASSKN